MDITVQSAGRAGQDVTRCGDCGATPVPTDISTGLAYYGKTAVCYVCACAREVTHLETKPATYVGYLSGDGRTITIWPGNPLMRVTHTGLWRSNWWHVPPLTYVRAVDHLGQEWYGRGAGRGMAIKMHPAKAR